MVTFEEFNIRPKVGDHVYTFPVLDADLGGVDKTHIFNRRPAEFGTVLTSLPDFPKVWLVQHGSTVAAYGENELCPENGPIVKFAWGDKIYAFKQTNSPNIVLPTGVQLRARKWFYHFGLLVPTDFVELPIHKNVNLKVWANTINGVLANHFIGP